MDINILASWKTLLAGELNKPYFLDLLNFVQAEYNSSTIYPTSSEIFNAFTHCPYEQTRVVIVGQDPYHGPNQANGFCFSVKDGVKKPPSLLNIFKEIQEDLGVTIPQSGNLERWATQGVLLLNATLTVRANLPGSHQNKGWEQFTDAVIKQISDTKENVVFLLWGAYAQHKGEVIDINKHLVLKSAHPSPFAAYRGFFGNRHFSKTNTYLVQQGFQPISW